MSAKIKQFVKCWWINPKKDVEILKILNPNERIILSKQNKWISRLVCEEKNSSSHFNQNVFQNIAVDIRAQGKAEFDFGHFSG